MKHRIFAMLLVLMMVLSIGCGNKGGDEKKPEGTNNNNSQTTPDPGTEADMEQTMIEKSLGNRGNNFRFKEFLAKLQAGTPVNVVFYGGSPSTNTNAGTDKTFPVLVAEYLNATYGNGNVNLINLSVDGSSSATGLIRAERDLAPAKADLIFLDFSANDADGKVDENGFECLLRYVLSLPEEPAVIVLNSVNQEGATQQDNINNFCFQYGVPSVNVKPAIFPFIEDGTGTYTWQNWSMDNIHPGPEGHLLYSKFIINLIALLDSTETAGAQAMPAKPIRAADHMNIKLVDRKTNTKLIQIGDAGDFTDRDSYPVFNNGWQKQKTDEESLSFQFRFTGKALYIVYKSSSDESYGACEVLVDGVVKKEMFGYPEEGGNDNPVTIMVFSEKKVDTHKIEIRMKEGNSAKKFSVLALGIVE